MKNFVYSALLYSDDYLPGVFGLKQSLNHVKSSFPFFLLVDDSLSQETFQKLDSFGIEYKRIHCLEIEHSIKRWNKTINYFQFWNFIEYDKICVLDLDVILLNNIDKVFEENDSDFSTIDLYGDDKYGSFNPYQLHTSLTLIKPQNHYWDYIIDRYKGQNLLEEQILYKEFFEKENFSFLPKKYLKDYYHDIRATKYWKRYNLIEKETPSFVNSFISNWWSSRKEENKTYACICYEWRQLPRILLLNYRLKKFNSSYPFLVLLPKDSRQIISVLEKENIAYKVCKELDENYFSLFCSLKEYNKVVYLNLDIYPNSNLDFLFSYPDGSAYYSGRNITPEEEILANDAILVFEPRYHHEYFYNIQYLLNDLPQERPPISHLWFHVKTSKAHQIEENGFMLFNKDRNRFDEISHILNKYNIIY